MKQALRRGHVTGGGAEHIERGLGMKETREHGAAMVEFAIIVPLLLMLVLGLIEFGYRYQRAAVLDNAAFIAARAMSLDKTTGEARAAAVAAGMPSAASFTAGPGACAAGANVTVTIQSVENSPTGIFFSQHFTINAKGVARCEG